MSDERISGEGHRSALHDMEDLYRYTAIQPEAPHSAVNQYYRIAEAV